MEQTLWTVLIAIGSSLATLVVSSWLRVRESRSVKLQEKQAEAIEGLYARIEAICKASNYVLFSPETASRPELQEALCKATLELDSYFGPRMLYFDWKLVFAVLRLQRSLAMLVTNNPTQYPTEDPRFTELVKWHTQHSGEIARELMDVNIDVAVQVRRLLGMDPFGYRLRMKFLHWWYRKQGGIFGPPLPPLPVPPSVPSQVSTAGTPPVCGASDAQPTPAHPDNH